MTEHCVVCGAKILSWGGRAWNAEPMSVILGNQVVRALVEHSGCWGERVNKEGEGNGPEPA